MPRTLKKTQVEHGELPALDTGEAAHFNKDIGY